MAKVLYVDTDAARARSVCALLAQKGHAVTTATSAERAMLHADREADFHVVVAHLILPSIDGAELCRWLQRWSSLAQVPRIVFTSPGVRLRLNFQDGLPRWLPADVYIHGLQDPESLVEAVEWVLHRP